MRYFIAFLLFLHGIISLMGFLKAFNILKLEQFEADISKTAGVFWLLSSVLLAFLVIQKIMSSDLFWILGSVSLVLSQIMIIWFWKDAKFGTIINVVLFVFVVISFSMWNHNRKGEQLGNILLENCKPLPMEENRILPELVQKWLEKSGAVESTSPSAVRFTQKGKLKLAPDKSWLVFNANQYVRLDDPSFIWTSTVGQGEILQFSGIDQFSKGEGKLNISLYGLIDVVNAKGGEIDQGAAVRFLSEIVWYPWMARSKFITWKVVGECQLEAAFRYEELEVEGLFTFDTDGFPVRFEALRYNEEKKKKIPWRVDIDGASYRELDNVMIPAKAAVIWEYESIDFHWLDVEVTLYDY